MTDIQSLVTDNLDIWTSAVETKSGVGRGSSKKLNLYGIKKLRELILELAVRGKLVPQDENDEPASFLLKKIAAEKDRLIKEKKIKKPKKLPEIGEGEKPFELPKGWEWEKLGRLTSLITDGTHYTPSYIDSGVSFISVKDIDGKTISFENCKYISQEQHEEINARCNPELGDILICRIGTLGRATIVDTEKPFSLFVSVGLLKLFQNYIIPRFSHLVLHSPLLTNQYDEIKAGGSHTNKLNLGDLPRLILPIPPLSEQHRIVTKVDELMALCDQLEQQTEDSITAHKTLVETLLATLTNSKNAEDLTQNWNRISDHFDTLFTTEESIDQLKQAILQLAVMGKLVPQDSNDEPASVLLDKIATEKARLIKEKKIKKQKALPHIGEDEKPFDLPEGWEWVNFESIAENCNHALKAGPFGSALKKSMYVESGFKIYGQEQAISGDETFGDYYIDSGKYEALKSCSVKAGDILISLVGTIGKVLILSSNCEPGIINPRLVKLSLYSDVNRSYIEKLLASPLIQEELGAKSHGGTMKILNLGLLKSIVFPMPPHMEQCRIVSKVDQLLQICDKLKLHIAENQTIQLHLADALTNKAVA